MLSIRGNSTLSWVCSESITNGIILMNQAIARAKKASKTGRKPLAIVEKGEKKEFDGLCKKLAAIQDEEEKNSERLLAARKIQESDKAAVSAGDLQALLKASQAREAAPGVIEGAESLAQSLNALREQTWRNEGAVVLTVLRRALNEAVDRQRALEAAEMREAEALGEAARPASAAHEFLQKRIRVVEAILANPGRLRNVRDPRKLLEDNLIFFAE